MAWRDDPTEVRREQGMYGRVLQEPGRPRLLRPLNCGGIAKRRQRSAARWMARSRSAAVGATKRGNRPKGPRRAKGGAGTRGHRRERDSGHRARTSLTGTLVDSGCDEYNASQGCVVQWCMLRDASEAVSRRAGCPNWARPDPWEPRGVIPGATRLSAECSDNT
jgi:hypothetical protein